ncbi:MULTISPECIES: flagellar type III secretion system pore protein FliP [Thalassobaculum]|uniref:Flagellar biosynthetic protein FliP n=1 Tax=Thalassobaculum litoreum DSM 18839 TaxID=1123362 RepID=A0A8G2EZZ3_9PROT|nr:MULTISPECIES: flagellar type III secretion system pore protein FliP [Thalassobaculum]SDG26964.1 flagellar biosynthetic protein FliP [Thalassobaculum litoreum DSM 18839]
MTARRLLVLLSVLAGLGGALYAAPVLAQSLTLDVGEPGGSTTARIIQLVALVTVLSLAPGILMMVTSFTRIIVVFSLLRSALGTQQAPPNIVAISLAMFMTAFIMADTFQTAWQNGVRPLIEEQIDEEEAFRETTAPFRVFMLAQVREKDLQLFEDIAEVGPAETGLNAPLQVLVPAFMISELRRAFEIGFLLYLPFVIIDMVIASVLMSMGMMMVPPVTISLPFKLIFFVLVDGWYMVAGTLVRSFAT